MMNANQSLDPLEGELYGRKHVEALPEMGSNTSIGGGLVSQVFQWVAVRNAVYGGPGTARGKFIRSTYQNPFMGAMSDYNEDRALSGALEDVRSKKKIPPQQRAVLDRYRELARKATPNAAPSIMGSSFMSPVEANELNGVRGQVNKIVGNLNPRERRKVLNNVEKRSGEWQAGKVANKLVLGGMSLGMGYEMGGLGVAAGLGVMGMGAASVPLAIANGYADARGHVGGAFGAANTLGKAIGPRAQAAVQGLPFAFQALEEGTDAARLAGGRAGQALAENLDNAGTHPFVQRHEGFNNGGRMSRGAALGQGIKKATIGRNHALGLSPRNLMLYGGLMAAGGVASALTRAPVGGRLASRFAGGEQTMAMLNDPQNVEARMLAMSHLQSDSISAAQAMGRESRSFLRQWTMMPTPHQYGFR